MKYKKMVKWALVLFPVMIVAMVAFLYSLASMTPSEYKPAQLSEPEKQQARKVMESKISTMLNIDDISKCEEAWILNLKTETITEIDPKTGAKRVIKRTSFDMPLGEEEFNNWLGSMSDSFKEKLANSGISSPAITISDKGVTMFAHIRKFDKVVGMEVDYEFNDDETVVFDIKPSSVGKLPIPEESVESYKSKLVEKARRDVKSVASNAKKMLDGDTGKLASNVIEGMGSAVGDAIAGEPVKIKFEQDGKQVRVRGVKTVDGKLTLDMVSDEVISGPPKIAQPAAPAADAAKQVTKQAAEKQPAAPKLTPEQMQAAELSAEQDKKLRSMAGFGN